MDVLNEEKPKAVEAVRLCCALMGVPVPQHNSSIKF